MQAVEVCCNATIFICLLFSRLRPPPHLPEAGLHIGKRAGSDAIVSWQL